MALLLYLALMMVYVIYHVVKLSYNHNKLDQWNRWKIQLEIQSTFGGLKSVSKVLPNNKVAEGEFIKESNHNVWECILWFVNFY